MTADLAQLFELYYASLVRMLYRRTGDRDRAEDLAQETFARAVELFGVRGTVEMAALSGDYLMVTTVYNALGMRLRPEQSATLPHRAGAPVGAEWR